jgi:hypothetical protein
LSAASFERAALAPDLAGGLPHYPVPAACSAVSRSIETIKGEGSVKRCCWTPLIAVRANTVMAVYALVVDVKNERARSFLRSLRVSRLFRGFSDMPRRLFLTLDTFSRCSST